jgi:hypothetical protein
LRLLVSTADECFAISSSPTESIYGGMGAVDAWRSTQRLQVSRLRQLVEQSGSLSNGPGNGSSFDGVTVEKNLAGVHSLLDAERQTLACVLSKSERAYPRLDKDALSACLLAGADAASLYIDGVPLAAATLFDLSPLPVGQQSLVTADGAGDLSGVHPAVSLFGAAKHATVQSRLAFKTGGIDQEVRSPRPWTLDPRASSQGSLQRRSAPTVDTESTDKTKSHNRQ